MDKREADEVEQIYIYILPVGPKESRLEQGSDFRNLH